MASNEKADAQAARHSVFVQRFAGGLANQLDPVLDRINRNISTALIGINDTSNNVQVQRAIRMAEQSTVDGLRAYTDEINAQLDEFVYSESEFEAASLKRIDDSYDYEPVGLTALVQKAVSELMVFPDSNQVTTRDEYEEEWINDSSKRVGNVIRTGAATSQTTPQIAAAITTLLNRRVKSTGKTMARTVTNHTSSVARVETIEFNNQATGYKWVSVLDNRTSSICRSLSGKEFKFTDRYKPLPPAHRGCRSSISPIFDGRKNIDNPQETVSAKGDDGKEQVSANSTYYSWLKNQDADFIDETIGPTRGKLLRNGGLTADQFANLNVDDLFRPITLKQMRQKAPMAFEKANLD